MGKGEKNQGKGKRDGGKEDSAMTLFDCFRRLWKES